MSGISWLKSRWDFERIFKEGKKFKSEHFILYRSSYTELRIGICVGKSLAKAVKRNHLKRRIKEIIRQYPFKRFDRDVILVSRSSLLSQNFQGIKKAVENVLAIAGL